MNFLVMNQKNIKKEEVNKQKKLSNKKKKKLRVMSQLVVNLNTDIQMVISMSGNGLMDADMEKENAHIE